MPYEPTRWVDNVTPINEANLNKIENQLVKDSTNIEDNQTNIQKNADDIKKVGKNTIKQIYSLEDVTEEGTYKYKGDLYVTKSVEWDTDLSKPFVYTGSASLLEELEFSEDKSSIPNGDTLLGIPLLRYENRRGDNQGGTYIFLGADGYTLLLYSSDLKYATPEPLESVDTYGEITVDLSFLTNEQWATIGLGEDICGNWAKIKQYFTMLDVQKVATKKDVDEKDALPPVTDADAGKFLRVSDSGVWEVQAIENGNEVAY